MLSDVVGEQVRRFREARNLRRIDLAERCADLGWPALTHGALGHLETGRRDEAGVRRREVTIDEVVILATALDVPPIALILPAGQVADIEITPGRWELIHEADAWLTAAWPGLTYRSDEYRAAAAPIRRLRDYMEAYARFMATLADTLPNRPDDVQERGRHLLPVEVEKLTRIVESMRAAGDVDPPLVETLPATEITARDHITVRDGATAHVTRAPNPPNGAGETDAP